MEPANPLTDQPSSAANPATLAGAAPTSLAAAPALAQPTGSDAGRSGLSGPHTPAGPVDGGDAGSFPPAGWMTNRQTAARLGIGLDTLVTPWKYRQTLKAAARTVRMPGGGRCNLYPVELVERIAAEREAANQATVPEGFVDGDGAAAILGIARGTWNVWTTDGTVEIGSASMPGAGGMSRRKLYAVAGVERVREELRAAGKLFIAPDELGPGKWLTIIEAAAVAGVVVSTWDIWSKSGRVPAGVWVKGPGGRPTQMWPEKVALGARTPETRDGTWVTTEEAIAILRTSKLTLPEWVREGRVPAGVPGRSNGSAATLWRAEELRALRAEWDARPFPPEGYVDRYQAAAMFGVQVAQFHLWQRQGRILYKGKLAKGPNGVACRIYAIDDLERAKAKMAAEDAAATKPPEGCLDREGAAAFFGITPFTLDNWKVQGRVTGTWHELPGRRGRRRVFPLAELERVREQMKAEASRPTAPEGFIELHEAARVLGVALVTLYQWEKRGQMRPGRVVPIPGTSARTKIYPVEEIQRLGEEIRKAKEHFPPEGWVEMKEAARRAMVSVEMWKTWLGDGRVENWKWARRPTMARCKLFSVEEIDRIVAELGRDHEFFMEPDGQGGWRPPPGYVDRDGAAEIFGVATGTLVHWQTEGRITCGRWARVPPGEVRGCGGRRVYPVEELRRLAEELAKVGKPYVDPNDPSIARVPIMSWSRTRFEAVIDVADLPLIEGMRWNWMPRYDELADGEAVVVRSAPSGEQVPLRRILLGLAGRQYHISHRNGDGLDCRRANLVVRTPTESLGHARKRRSHLGQPCTSRFKGVSWNERTGKWLAQIQKEGNHRRLGYFRSEIAAAQAYDEAARELFGEHARPNFPDGVDAWIETSQQLAAA